MSLKENNKLQSDILMFEDLENLYHLEAVENISDPMNVDIERGRAQFGNAYKTIINHINNGEYDPCRSLNLFDLREKIKKMVDTGKMDVTILRHNIFKPQFRHLNNSKVINELIKLSTFTQKYFDEFYNLINSNHKFYYDNLSVINMLYIHLSRGSDLHKEPLNVPNDFTDKLIKSISHKNVPNKIDLYREIIFNEDDFQNKQLIYHIDSNKDINLNTIYNTAMCLENKTIIEYINKLENFSINHQDEMHAHTLEMIRNINDLGLINTILSNPKLKGDVETFVPYLIQIGAKDEALKYVTDKRFAIKDVKQLIMSISDAIGINCYSKMGETGISKNKIIKENILFARKVSELILERIEKHKRSFSYSITNDFMKLNNYKFDEQRSKRLIRYYPHN